MNLLSPLTYWSKVVWGKVAILCGSQALVLEVNRRSKYSLSYLGVLRMIIGYFCFP